MTTRWMCLGSSPSAPEHHDIPDVDVVVSSGDAILLRDPDYYLIIEEEAIWRYQQERVDSQTRGTKVVLRESLFKHLRGKRRLDIVIDRYYQPCNEFLPLNGVENDRSWKSWIPGTYTSSCSGVVGLQYAINHGASEIHMVGMEGYFGLKNSYFTDSMCNPGALRWAPLNYYPLTQLIVDLCPDVNFITYGILNYSLDGANVSHANHQPRSHELR